MEHDSSGAHPGRRDSAHVRRVCTRGGTESPSARPSNWPGTVLGAIGVVCLRTHDDRPESSRRGKGRREMSESSAFQPTPADLRMLDTIQSAAFGYFLQETNRAN